MESHHFGEKTGDETPVHPGGKQRGQRFSREQRGSHEKMKSHVYLFSTYWEQCLLAARMVVENEQTDRRTNAVFIVRPR